jgi:hypothetical protein
MASGCRRGRVRFRSRRWSMWSRCRNMWTRRRLGDYGTWRRRNLCGLNRWNDHRLRNCRRRRSHHSGLCFDGAHGRRYWAAWLGNNRSGWRRNHRRRRRRSYHSGLHASSSGGRLFRSLVRYCLLFGLCFRVGDRTKVLAHPYSGFYLNRAGMRFFLGNSGLGQIVNDGFCLDLELTSQFVDSDLIRICHCPPGRLLFALLVRNFR